MTNTEFHEKVRVVAWEVTKATVAREVTRATKKEGLDFTPEPTVLKGIEKALSFF